MTGRGRGWWSWARPGCAPTRCRSSRVSPGLSDRVPLPMSVYGRLMLNRLPIVVALIVLAFPAAASAQQRLGSLQPTPANGPAPKTVAGEVIVQFAPGVSASARGHVRRATDVGVEEAVYRPGQQLLKVQLDQTVSNAIRELERDPRVVYAQPNRVYQAAAVPDDAAFGQLWGLRNLGQTVHGVPGTTGTPGADIGATTAWDRTVGSRSILVAVTDTG